MPAKAGKTPQVRLSKKNSDGIKKLVKTTRRTIAAEANMAVENHLALMESRRTGK